MKILFYRLIILTIILSSCNSNTIIKKPDNLITKEIMIDILTDTYLSRSAKNSINKNGEKRINYHTLIYKKHNVDSLSFNQSLKYYTSDISLNEEILKQIKINIDKQLDQKSKEFEKQQLE